MKNIEQGMPKVSYLVASYTHVQYIKQTIDSILNQTYPNIEVIVCDDCSKDNSREFLAEYAKEIFK